MKNEKKQRSIFIAFAFTWSFAFWGLSIFFAVKNNITLLQNADLLRAILDGTLGSERMTVTILSFIAVYGPMLAALFMLITVPKARDYFKGKFKLNTPFKYVLAVLGLFCAISLLPAIPLAIANGIDGEFSFGIIGFILLFFLYQFITSGTEEIGWRGYLLPSLLKEKTPWKASVHLGLIWALWHTPIVLYIFYAQGLPIPQIVVSFIGFVAGIIAMSAIYTYYYIKTKNVLFSMFIHTIANTFPMIVGLLVADSYQVSIAVQVLLWVFVIILSNKNKEIFDKVQTEI